MLLIILQVLVWWSPNVCTLRKSTLPVANYSVLIDIQLIEVPPSSIFFLETSFRHFETRKFELNRRSACCVESAASRHPERSVFVIYAAPGISRNLRPENQLLKALETYRNVKFVQVHIGRFLRGTPIDKLYWNRLIDLSAYKISHYSDVLRTVALWKYGGIYLDNDVLVLKSFDDLGENFVGYQECYKSIGSGVLGFGRNSVPHNFLTQILSNINNHYNRNSWAGIGPELYTRSLQQVCATSNIENVLNNECSGIKVLSSNFFYPIGGTSWKKFFYKTYADEVTEASANSYALHFWNSQNQKSRLKLDSEAPLVEFAKKHCPRIFAKINDYF